LQAPYWLECILQLLQTLVAIPTPDSLPALLEIYKPLTIPKDENRAGPIHLHGARVTNHPQYYLPRVQATFSA
jgi:hypothetical protein